MKKFLALLLALVMALSLVACGGDTDATTAPTENNGTTAPSESTAPSEDTQPTEPAVKDTYTYDVNLTEFPTLWNPHTYQTSTDASILSYTTDSLYTFDYNEDETGFALVPSMATEDPIDITSEYVGQYGIEEGDVNLVYKMNLRTDLAWEDGTPINAYSFVESAKRLLNPAAKNFRADSLYTGEVKIYNAENYLKQGSYAYSNMISANYGDEEYTLIADMTAKEDGTLAIDGKGDIWFILNDGGNWGSNGLQDYYDYGYLAGSENATNLWENVIVPAADENGYVAVTAEIANALSDCVAVLHGYTDAAEYAAAAGDYAYLEWEEFCYYGADFPEMDWSEVGIFALSEYELVYVLINPSAGFDLKYALPDGYLVHTATYDACESIDENGLYTNTYCTSAETTVSYGPYTMESFQADKEVHYTRNDSWHGIVDGQYQTTDIVIHCVPEASTRLQMLISGELDTYGLQKEDMDTYLLSDYTYLSQSASVWGMVFNPDKAALETKQAEAGENINKTILTVIEFRQAMAYGMNRTEFSLATMPTCTPTFGLLSNQHIVDTTTGVGYRSTDIAKQVLVDFWGLADDIGEGKLYADLDEAVESITGYNPELAKQKFNEAYDIAIAEGLMDEDDTIQICIGLPTATSSTYNNGYEFIVNNYTELVKGTKLEGKLTFTRNDTIGNGFGDRLRDNTVDMLFYVGFSGSELNPYYLMEVYVDGGNLQYDPAIDYTTIDLTIEINGTEMTTSVYNWFAIMNGAPCDVTLADGTTTSYSCGSADGDTDARLQILGAVEGAIMMNYDFIPLSGDSSAQLVGQQVHYYSDEYMYGVGFGGIQYMTYNYSDAEWAEYVASCKGELDYT